VYVRKGLQRSNWPSVTGEIITSYIREATTHGEVAQLIIFRLFAIVIESTLSNMSLMSFRLVKRPSL
jgi:hypothetical protein